MTEHAKDNAAACLADILREAALLAADPDAVTEGGQPVIDAWLERPLDALIRSDWHGTGHAGESTEYALLLTTGGPALRVTGELNGYGEPDTARLEYQDWGTPWTEYFTTLEESDALLTFANTFYFGA